MKEMKLVEKIKEWNEKAMQTNMKTGESLIIAHMFIAMIYSVLLVAIPDMFWFVSGAYLSITLFSIFCAYKYDEIIKRV